MRLLHSINSPTDLKKITSAQIPALAAEVREFLIDRVSKTGGHLGPNLGVVELTIAIHRVFDSPQDAIIWDTGHQSYVHKMFTGRLDQFSELRKKMEYLGIRPELNQHMTLLKILMLQLLCLGLMELRELMNKPVNLKTDM